MYFLYQTSKYARHIILCKGHCRIYWKKKYIYTFICMVALYDHFMWSFSDFLRFLCILINRLQIFRLSKLNVQVPRHFSCWIRLENIVRQHRYLVVFDVVWFKNVKIDLQCILSLTLQSILFHPGLPIVSPMTIYPCTVIRVSPCIILQYTHI